MKKIRGLGGKEDFNLKKKNQKKKNPKNQKTKKTVYGTCDKYCTW